MHLHEYQAKQLLSDHGVAVPAGRVAATAEEAAAAAAALGGERWAVKAQVHAGGRGKAGGVRLVDGVDAVAEAAEALLGRPLVTHQSGPAGLPVQHVLVEAPVAVEREYYLGLLIDRARERLAVIASAAGGMDIETVAAEQPAAILSETIDPAAGLQPYQCRKLAFGLGLRGEAVKAFADVVGRLVRLAGERDAALVEINPLVSVADGGFVALDAKVDVDDNALYRQRDLAALRDTSQEEAREREAREHGLNYVTLEGTIACMVNGAGLAMATMDLIKLHGGEPANFLDVGGSATAERVAAAFRLILSDPKVKAILVNIFGGIVRCDLIAEGIVQAVRETNVTVPVVVRLEGTNVERGRELLAASGLAVDTATDLSDAARRAVRAGR